MIIGAVKETAPGERRAALVPEILPPLSKAGLDVLVEAGLGVAAGFPDEAYVEKGAKLDAATIEKVDILLKVQPPAADEIGRIKEGAVLIGFLSPYSNPDGIKRLAERKVTAFSMELMPRITRAQSMDALSAMSTVAGYKAVLLAAAKLHKFFPLLMTAAGTVPPARVFVVGAGVAGLQAIGTARRLGAVVEAYDTRPVVKEQVESLGAKFVEFALETKDAQDKGGYAKAQSEEFYKKQQEAMARVVAAADVVITTALVPGKPAPKLITDEAIKGMRPGSVIVDLAAEAGGNCVGTEPGQEAVKHGVTILGPLNIASTVPLEAARLYSRTVVNFVRHLVRDGKVNLDTKDELTKGPLVTHAGEVVHDAVKAQMSPPPVPATAAATA